MVLRSENIIYHFIYRDYMYLLILIHHFIPVIICVFCLSQVWIFCFFVKTSLHHLDYLLKPWLKTLRNELDGRQSLVPALEARFVYPLLHLDIQIQQFDLNSSIHTIYLNIENRFCKQMDAMRSNVFFVDIRFTISGKDRMNVTWPMFCQCFEILADK